MRSLLLQLLLLMLPVLLNTCQESLPPDNDIRPSSDQPEFWSYNNEKVLLLGGSSEDNLFQVTGLEKQLDVLKEAGGNYVRNTMSSRDSGNLWPFMMNGEGLYDLGQWNDEYWVRFERLLTLAEQRDVIVQVEVWATFDFYRENWDVNPFNPRNNINYSARRSKLPEVVDSHPVYTENNFFRSVPSQMALAPVLEYQSRFVDKLLSYSLLYPNVLYCIDNETSVTSDWAKFWAGYIHKRARGSGKQVFVTEMWDPWDLSHPFHNETFDHPGLFGFVDISQNNHITGEAHWSNGLKQIGRLKRIGAVRPVNNVKVYGNDGGRHKTTRQGTESFIQNVFMGCASTRFHRPTSGQGLNERAQHVIRSMRSLTGRMDWFAAEPSNSLLAGRQEHEAYCRALKGSAYAVYFPDGGEVSLQADGKATSMKLEWLDVLQSEWQNGKPETGEGGRIILTAPGPGHWVALMMQQ